jgi:hypothetical protein
LDGRVAAVPFANVRATHTEACNGSKEDKTTS